MGSADEMNEDLALSNSAQNRLEIQSVADDWLGSGGDARQRCLP
jgi:hypothetical protein